MKEYMVIKNYHYAEVYYVDATSSRHAISIVDDIEFDQEPDDIVQDFDFYDASEYKKPLYHDEMLKIAKRIINLDWYYEYSDDHRVWVSGHFAMRELSKDLYSRSVSEFDLENIKNIIIGIVMPNDEDERKIAEWNYRFFLIQSAIKSMEEENNG